MINSNLWKSIEAFDLDRPLSEYGFSTRLAKENCWTANFTADAILEYKKFMFLAATTEFMVSPSEIVDVVWHQHLVFTQSYTELCNILGRRIEHLPSTRNKEDFDKFRQAKDRTTKYYNEIFGEQPATFWYYPDIYAPLTLEKANMKIRTFLLIAVFAWIIALLPAYFILCPLYITIDSEYFLTGFFMLALSCFIILEYFNRERLNAIVKDWIKDAFVFDLTAMELVYLKHQRLEEVIHGYVSHLVEDGKIEIEKHNHLKWVKHATPTDAIEYIIAESVKESGDHGYRGLIYKLKLKPAIFNIAASMEGLKKYFIKSKMFSNMFSLNFVVLSVVLMLGMVRMITGIMREKPVGILFVMLVAFICLMVLFLKRLSSMMTSSTIPGFYTEQIAPEMQKAEHWDWAYFMMGSAVLAETFMPVYRDIEGGSYGGGGGDVSSGSSCGSGCGSSCGGGCGGCGGG